MDIETAAKLTLNCSRDSLFLTKQWCAKIRCSIVHGFRALTEKMARLPELLRLLEEKSGKMSGINVEEYLTADDDLMAFAGVTEEDILSEITEEMENDEDDTDPSQSLLTFQKAL
ncbi:hypothetical protein AVEN_118621-1 [Araneus ventricosus]|uniref:Uncharacterized protein n=1 Tax=Araneus ventricosus TaxID=182803 RepID=A0A4Y2AYR5_ARAVE|nr:hypothetical protein AVEN_118621-1 [Araneus ventricosus]